MEAQQISAYVLVHCFVSFAGLTERYFLKRDSVKLQEALNPQTIHLTIRNACKRNNFILMLPFMRCSLIFLKSNNLEGTEVTYGAEGLTTFMSPRDLSNCSSEMLLLMCELSLMF